MIKKVSNINKKLSGLKIGPFTTFVSILVSAVTLLFLGVVSLSSVNIAAQSNPQFSQTVDAISKCNPSDDTFKAYTCRLDYTTSLGTDFLRGRLPGFSQINVNRKATVIFVGKKVVGFKDCHQSIENSGVIFGVGAYQDGYEDPNCKEFVTRKLSVGDDWTPQKQRELERKALTQYYDIIPIKNKGGILDTCQSETKEFDNRYVVLKCDGETYIKDNVTQNVRYKPDTNFETANIGNLSAIDKGLLEMPSAENITSANLTPEQVLHLQNAYILKKQTEASGEIKCENPLIKDGKIIFSCKRGDKLVNPNGDEITGADCGGVSIDGSKINITSPELTFDTQCITTASLNATKGDSANKALGASTTTTEKEIKKEGTNPATNLLSSLGSVMVVILFYLVYIFGWIGSILLWWLGIIFINILAINPASPDFIGAALRPWQILTGLANLLILATFIMVGFGYILNIKSLKRNIQEFLLQISIFALLLNFTLLGTAVVVNLAQGIGDVMIYTTVGAKNGRPNRELLIDGFIRGLNRISYVRCGIYRENASLATQEPDACKNSADAIRRGRERGALTTVTDQAGDFGRGIANFNSQGGLDFGGILTNAGVQSNVLRMTLLESLFLFVVIYALVQLWNGLSLVMFRLIGLWLLMVTSPVALALYFLPVKSLSKYANEWMDKFWRSTFFYPFFVLALVLHMRLVEALSLAVYQPGFLPDGATVSTGGNSSSGNPAAFGGSIEVYAATDQQLWRTAIITLVSGSILAFIAIGTFSLIIKFFRDTFGAIVSAVAKSVGTAWNALRTAGIAGAGVIGGLGRVGGKILDGGGRYADEKWLGGRAGNLMKGVSEYGDNLAKRGGFKGLIGKGIKWGGGLRLGSISRGIANGLSIPMYAPLALETTADLAKNVGTALMNQSAARSAVGKAAILGKMEQGLRSIPGARDALNKLGLDIDTVDGLNLYKGWGAKEMAKNKDRVGLFLNDKLRQIEEDKKKLGSDVPTGVASARLESLADIKKSGKEWSQQEKQEFERLANQGVFDPILAKQIASSRELSAEAAKMYDEGGFSQKARAEMNKKYTNLISEQARRDRAATVSPLDFKDMPTWGNDTPEFYDSLENNGQIGIDDRRQKQGNQWYGDAEVQRQEANLKNLLSLIGEKNTAGNAAYIQFRNGLTRKQWGQNIGALVEEHVNSGREINMQNLVMSMAKEYGVALDPSQNYSTQQLASEIAKIGAGQSTSGRLQALESTYAGGEAKKFIRNYDSLKSDRNADGSMKDAETRERDLQTLVSAIQGGMTTALGTEYAGRQTNLEALRITAKGIKNAVSKGKESRYTQDYVLEVLNGYVDNIKKFDPGEGRELIISSIASQPQFLAALGADAMESTILREAQTGLISGYGDILTPLTPEQKAKMAPKLARANTDYVRYGQDRSSLDQVIAEINVMRRAAGGQDYNLSDSDIQEIYQKNILGEGQAAAQRVFAGATNETEYAERLFREVDRIENKGNNNAGQVFQKEAGSTTIFEVKKAAETIRNESMGLAQGQVETRLSDAKRSELIRHEIEHLNSIGGTLSYDETGKEFREVERQEEGGLFDSKGRPMTKTVKIKEETGRYLDVSNNGVVSAVQSNRN